MDFPPVIKLFLSLFGTFLFSTFPVFKYRQSRGAGQDEFWGIFLEICVTVVPEDRMVYNQKNEHIFGKEVT